MYKKGSRDCEPKLCLEFVIWKCGQNSEPVTTCLLKLWLQRLAASPGLGWNTKDCVWSINALPLLLFFKEPDILIIYSSVMKSITVSRVQRKREWAGQSDKKRKFIWGKTRGWLALEKNQCPPFLMGSFLYCCSHTFWETNSLRRTLQIVEWTQFITPVGQSQSLLLAKDPGQVLWKPYIP